MDELVMLAQSRAPQQRLTAARLLCRVFRTVRRLAIRTDGGQAERRICRRRRRRLNGGDGGSGGGDGHEAVADAEPPRMVELQVPLSLTLVASEMLRDSTRDIRLQGVALLAILSGVGGGLGGGRGGRDGFGGGGTADGDFETLRGHQVGSRGAAGGCPGSLGLGLGPFPFQDLVPPEQTDAESNGGEGGGLIEPTDEAKTHAVIEISVDPISVDDGRNGGEGGVEDGQGGDSGEWEWVWVRADEAGEEAVGGGAGAGAGADDSDGDVDSETRLLVRDLRLERASVKREEEEAAAAERERESEAADGEEEGGTDDESVERRRLRVLGVQGPLSGPVTRGRLLQR